VETIQFGTDLKTLHESNNTSSSAATVDDFTDCDGPQAKSFVSGLFPSFDVDWFKASYDEETTCLTPWSCLPICSGESTMQTRLLVGDDAQMKLCTYWNPNLGDAIVDCPGATAVNLPGYGGAYGCCDQSSVDGDDVIINMDFDSEWLIDKGTFFFSVEGVGSNPYECDFTYTIEYGVF